MKHGGQEPEEGQGNWVVSFGGGEIGFDCNFIGNDSFEVGFTGGVTFEDGFGGGYLIGCLGLYFGMYSEPVCMGQSFCGQSLVIDFACK